MFRRKVRLSPSLIEAFALVAGCVEFDVSCGDGLRGLLDCADQVTLVLVPARYTSYSVDVSGVFRVSSDAGSVEDNTQLM
jgi:hypothetical protein